jgi:hypothetical protein
MRRALTLAPLLLCACDDPAPPPPRARDAAARPVFPASSGLRNVRLECFPAGFRVARARVREGRVELCGRAPTGAPRCYRIDPATSEVLPGDARDAPTGMPAEPVIEAPLSRGEVMVRGGRASLRGGTLTTVGGRTQVAQAQQLGFTALENAVVVSWTDGWFVGVIGVRPPDLGASAFVDPSNGHAVGRSPVLPCDGGV